VWCWVLGAGCWVLAHNCNHKHALPAFARAAPLLQAHTGVRTLAQMNTHAIRYVPTHQLPLLLAPAAGEDGTPNESVMDVLARVQQVLSITETQYSGADVAIIAPDADVLSVMQVGRCGVAAWWQRLLPQRVLLWACLLVSIGVGWSARWLLVMRMWDLVLLLRCCCTHCPACRCPVEQVAGAASLPCSSCTCSSTCTSTCQLMHAPPSQCLRCRRLYSARTCGGTGSMRSAPASCGCCS
jgi:hypothetical protein